MGHFCLYAPFVLPTKLVHGSFRRAPVYLSSHAFCAAINFHVKPYCTTFPIRQISDSKYEKRKYTSNNLYSFDTLNIEQKGQVSLFVHTLLEWNQRMNLTAVTEHCAVMERHVEDSLALLPIIENAYNKHCAAMGNSKLKVVDVGSGAGLPGVILAIARPDWQVTLIESLQKRCCFLEYVVEASGVSNIEIVHMRAEKEVENAKEAIGLMGAFMLQLCSVASEGPYGQRTAVLCLKDRPTPARYPRQPGLPAKQPL